MTDRDKKEAPKRDGLSIPPESTEQKKRREQWEDSMDEWRKEFDKWN